MKLAELFEAPLPIKKVTGQYIELDGPPGVKTTVDLDGAGRNVRIDPNTGVMTNEPSEVDETKIAQGIKAQIGGTIAIREKPYPAAPTMYYIPTDEELAGFNINQSQFDLIGSGRFYVLKTTLKPGDQFKPELNLNPNLRPKLESWKDMQVTANPGGPISLELERSPAEQARIARIMQRQRKPLYPQVSSESVELEEGEKDACYRKVKSRYKIWPSAYASGALVKCRKVGAKNWGNKSKKK